MIGQDEINLVSAVFSFLNEKPIIFDIGSNKMDWSDIILNEYGENCTIHAFEPNKMLLDYSRIKYEYKTNIVYNELAAYSYDGIAQFYYFENFNNELSSLYKQNWDGEMPMKKGVVTTVKIDTYCEVNGIDYIDYLKIDCEGSDVDVLMGAMEMMKVDKIRFVQIEYGSHYKAANKTFKDVIETVNNWGYKVYSFIDNNYNEVSHETFIEDYHYENYLITKEAIHSYSADGGWLRAFKESVEGLPKFNFMLECGVFEGYTTRYMCENMLEEGGRVIAVDPLLDYYTEETKDVYPEFKGAYQRFLRNTKGLPIELRRQDSRVALPDMHEFRFDFAYVDGNHDISYIDAVNVFPIMQEGAYILFDDANGWSDAATAGIQRFLREYDGYYEIIKNGYQLLIKKTKNYHGTI